MAGVKISALPALSATALTDIYPTVQAGVTYKVTLSQLIETATTQQAVRLATTGALTVTYNNGTAGVGATLTNAGALAALSIDGVATVVGDRILVKDQASTLQNGIYTVTNIGSAIVAWVLTRATDYDEASDVDAGDSFTVAFGTTNAKTQWIQTAVVATMGTDPITFESNVVAGAGITKTNNTIAVTSPVAAVGAAGTILRSNGAAWVASTSTFADTYAINSILFASASNAVTALAPALSSVLISSAASTGVPVWSGALANGQLIIGSTGATPVVANLTPGTGISIANGAGTVTISATGGGFGVATIAGTSQAAAVNTMYIALNAGQTTLTLPAVFSVGDSIILVGSTANTGGWIVTASAGDTVIYNGSTTSAGGTLTSSALAGQTVELVCDVANTSWVVVDTVNTTLTTA